MKTKDIVINGVIMALYFVVTAVVAPFGFTNIQFRVSELFNHLIVFQKKYFFGIIGGVFLANLLLSPLKVDLIFGVLHSAISLGITIFIGKFVTDKIKLMWINSFVFSFNMFIIAYMLKVFMHLSDGFFFLWTTLAISEFVMMGVAVPVVHFISHRVNLSKSMT